MRRIVGWLDVAVIGALVPPLVVACGTGEQQTARAIEEAKHVTAEFTAAPWTPPPRTIGDERALARTSVSFAEIQSLSDRIKVIRDKVFVHIDKDGVFDPDAFYAEANITGRETERVSEALWLIINDLYVEAIGEEFKREPDYTGQDIAELHTSYMAHVVPQKESRLTRGDGSDATAGP